MSEVIVVEELAQPRAMTACSASVSKILPADQDDHSLTLKRNGISGSGRGSGRSTTDRVMIITQSHGEPALPYTETLQNTWAVVAST